MRERFFKTYQILMIDVVSSWFASFIVLFLFLLFSSFFIVIPDFIQEWILFSLISSFIGFFIFQNYRSIIRYASSSEFSKIGLVCLAKEIFLWLFIIIFSSIQWGSNLLLGFIIIDFFITLSLLLLVKILMRVIFDKLNARSRIRTYRNKLKNILVYGSSEKSVAVVSRLKNSTHYNVKGFLLPSTSSKHTAIAGNPIFYYKNSEDLESLTNELNLDGILYSTSKDLKEEELDLSETAQQLGLKQYITPVINEIEKGELPSINVRKIRIEDLLGRDEIKISLNEISDFVRGKTIMVTGAAGSIGSELCRQLASFEVKELVLYDNAETPLHNIRLELEDRYPHLAFYPVIGDVRSKKRLDFVFSRHSPEIVFHAAAYKHVPLMEENPCEAVLVNVAGSKYVADKCLEYDVERMIMVSTDKAVNPTNIMGCTKRLAEIYVQSLGLAVQSGKIQGTTNFVTTRFGNVLGSNGSVIPRFRQQIEKGGPITVTHPDINRFFMTIPEACRLVMEAATFAHETEIFVFDMGEPVKIVDLAIKMIELAGLRPNIDIKLKFTGLRPGEKLFEEVLASKENTLPTSHDRIYIASVRKYSYSQAEEIISNITELAYDWKIPEMVKKMKQAVPEFKSNNSEFEKLDIKDT